MGEPGHERGQELADVLRASVDPALGGSEGPGERALRAFFTEVPAHIAAVNNLDHTQFVNPLCFGPVRVALGDVLAPFKALGLGPYGDAWLRLLDVAEAAGPGTFPDTGSARQYIRMRQEQTAAGLPSERFNGLVACARHPPPSHSDGCPNAAVPGGVVAGATGGDDPFGGALGVIPSSEQLEGILQSVLGAFPGMRDCVSQLVASAEAAGSAGTEGSMNAVVDQVQRLLTGPLLSGLQRQTGASDERLRPCIQQILDGFRGLNAALVGAPPEGAAS